MRVVIERTSTPVPEVFAFSATAKNPFGYRYILMEAVTGDRLRQRMSSLPKKHQDKIANQFAGLIFELSKVIFDGIGNLWYGDSVEEDPEVVALEALDAGSQSLFMRQLGPFNTSLEHFYRLTEGLGRAVRFLRPGDKEFGMAG
jgi:isoamyl acetate esterase